MNQKKINLYKSRCESAAKFKEESIMKKLRRMGLVCLTVLAMILPVCPASAATIEDQSKVIFYQNGAAVAKDAIAAGEVTAKVRVASETLDQNQGFKIILAAYNSNKTELKDVSYQSASLWAAGAASVKAPAERSFTVGPVTVPEDGSAEVYIWNNDLTPEGEGVGIVNRGTYCLSGIKLGNYTTAVDQIGKRILVNTTEDVTGAQISNVKAPDGYTCAWSGNAIVLTAPDGTAVTYPVLKTDAFSAYDFEDGMQGWKSNGGTAEDGCTVEQAVDKLDSSNHVIKLTDNSATKAAVARLDVKKSYPYVVSYKVLYDMPNEGDNILFSGMRLWKSTEPWESMAGASVGYANASDASDGYVFVGEGRNGGNPIYTRAFFDLNTWHEASIAYVDENTAEYYFDGKLVAVGKPGDNVGDLASLRFMTSPNNATRTCTVYLDDVIIRDYYLQKAELSSASFVDAEGNPVAGFMHDGTVYANASDLTGLTLGQVSVSDGAAAALSGSQITVTSADGLVNNYPVVAKPFFSDNFESYAEGAVLQSVNPDWYIATTNETGRTALVAKDGSNGLLRLTSNTNRKAFVYTQIKIPNQSKSFVAQYRVRYGLVADTTFGSDVSPYYSYVGRYMNDGKNMSYGLQPVSGVATGMTLQGSAKTNVTKSGAIALNQWYTMKIVYRVTTGTDGNETAKVTYYLDGELLGTKDMEANVQDINPNYLEIRTGNRTCVTDYDDITILPL